MPVDKTTHDLKKFDCGKSDMNFFLSRNAVKNRKLGLSSTWVLTEEEEPSEGSKLHALCMWVINPNHPHTKGIHLTDSIAELYNKRSFSGV